MLSALMAWKGGDSGVCQGSLLVLGTLCGAAPYLLWEAEALERRVIASKGSDGLSPCEKAALRRAQYRCHGSHRAFHSPEPVTDSQSALRAVVAATGHKPLGFALGGSGGLEEGTLAMRVVQVLVYDYEGGYADALLTAVSTSEPTSVLGFIPFISARDSVSVVLAMDLFMALVVCGNKAEPLVHDGIRAVSGLLESSDPFIVSKALEVLGACCAVSDNLPVVCEELLPVVHRFVAFEPFLSNDEFDSAFVLEQTLGVICKFCKVEKVWNCDRTH